MILLKYKIIDQRIDFNIIGGLSTGILVDNDAYIKLNNEKHHIGKTESVNNEIYNATFGIGMNYPVSKHIIFNLEPILKYSLKPTNSFNSKDYHPYSIGFFFGLNYVIR